MDELNRQILESLKNIESRVATLEAAHDRLAKAYSKARTTQRRPWVRPPIWTFEQHSPRPLKLTAPFDVNIPPASAPRIGIVTPTYNYARYLAATINSVLEQGYPNLAYHVQDAISTDDTVALLKKYGDRLSWRSEPDNGQAHAINLGFAGNDFDIMGYLNSDDTLLPGTLAYVANAFQTRPDVDIVYGHRIFIDRDGLEIGRAVSCLLMTRKRCVSPATFRRRPCSGAAASGKRSDRWTRVSNTRSIGTSCCARRTPASNWQDCRDFSPAFVCTMRKRRRANTMSATRRCSGCGSSIWASHRPNGRFTARCVPI
ncbi:glycosyltransferase [Bradyrhizobium sp. McL0616]|uniref:glycosyltransferase n=1 Tax=Bradyrhizobium sp. McL0616 TaxID=3415674 RepID=UPI003CEF314B